MGQALVLCLGILVMFLVVVPELPESSAASAGLFTLILGWVMLRPILEQRRSERSEPDFFNPPIPAQARVLAPALPAMETPARRRRWTLDRLVGTMAATVFVVIVATVLGPQWMDLRHTETSREAIASRETLTESHRLESNDPGVSTVEPPSPGAAEEGCTSKPPPIRKGTPPPSLPSTRPVPSMPPPSAPPPPNSPPTASEAPSTPRPLPSAPPRASASLSEVHRIGPDDLLVLVPREASTAQTAFHQALRERLRNSSIDLLWAPGDPARHPSSGQEARSIAARMLVIRTVDSREMPSSSERVKFFRITLDGTVFTNGNEQLFQCDLNGMGGSESVALQQAADRCVRDLLSRLGN